MRSGRNVIEVLDVRSYEAVMPGVFPNQDGTHSHVAVVQGRRQVVLRLAHVKVEKHHLFPRKGGYSSEVHGYERLALTRNCRADGNGLCCCGWVKEVEVRPKGPECLGCHRLRMTHHVQRIAVRIGGSGDDAQERHLVQL